MAINVAHVSARIPVQDLDRARQWYRDKLGLDPVEERAGGLRYVVSDNEFALYLSAGRSDGSFTQLAFTVEDLACEMAVLAARGVTFVDYDTPELATNDGVAQVVGNYPSKGTGEQAAWFHDSEGNLLAIGQPTR